jgi:cAMP-specific phosphodiesterase 4
MEELYSQGDKELARGLPVTDICDRTQYLLPRSQLGFIEYIVQPLFVAYCELLPTKAPIQDELMACLEENRSYWRSQIDSLPKPTDSG